MNWFQGEIVEAIAKTKRTNSIFVVYSEGEDDKSKKITDLINTTEISSVLGSTNFVAIKLQAGSVSFQQFSQIYKDVPVPSIYFIGKQGSALEIVTEASDSTSLSTVLKLVLEKAGLKPVETEESRAAPANVVCEDGVCTLVKPEDNAPKTVNEASSSKEEKVDLSAEEKLERAKALLEQQRVEKEQEEKAKQRQQEIERRKMGQNVQQMKRWQDDQKLKELVEERERDKRESKVARDRVLAQIAQDKAERAARFQTAAPQPHPEEKKTPPRPTNSTTSRLQFRMPDGRTAMGDFSAQDTLETVHTYIRDNLNLPFHHYTLSTTFPRREFGTGDRSQKLADLGLVPNAVILILPLNRGAVSTNDSGGGFVGMIWAVLAPVFGLLTYLRGLVFGAAPNNGNSSGNAAASAAGSSSNKRVNDAASGPGTAGQQQAKVRKAGEGGPVRRQGNIHRLSDRNDSDDENNTWNGNSTQQM